MVSRVTLNPVLRPGVAGWPPANPAQTVAGHLSGLVRSIPAGETLGPAPVAGRRGDARQVLAS